MNESNAIARPRCCYCGDDNVTILVEAQVERDGVVFVTDSDEPEGPRCAAVGYCQECERDVPVPTLPWSNEARLANIAAFQGPRLRDALQRLHRWCIASGLDPEGAGVAQAAACLRYCGVEPATVEEVLAS